MIIKVCKELTIKKMSLLPRLARMFQAFCLATVMAMLMITQGDMVYLALSATETTETLIGTMNIPTAGVRKIVGVYGALMQPTATAGETNSGYFRLQFSTVAGTFKFPATMVYGPAGTLASNAHIGAVQIIPVDIPVPPNESVKGYMTANKALTGTGEGLIGLIME